VVDLTGDAQDLGDAEAIEIIDRLIPVAGLDVVDVGCGKGELARQLAGRGARVVGVEPDPLQAAKNKVLAAMPGLSFVEAPGQGLPLADTSMDGVFLRFSLHHVPRELMGSVLEEAMRVLRPASGFLCVMEPLLSGSLEAVYKPFHDETEMRILAYAALKRTAAPCFLKAREYRFTEYVRYADFASFVDEVAGSTYSGIVRQEVEAREVQELFEAGKAADGYMFSQHVRVNLYQGLEPVASRGGAGV